MEKDSTACRWRISRHTPERKLSKSDPFQTAVANLERSRSRGSMGFIYLFNVTSTSIPSIFLHLTTVTTFRSLRNVALLVPPIERYDSRRLHERAHSSRRDKNSNTFFGISRHSFKIGVPKFLQHQFPKSVTTASGACSETWRNHCVSVLRNRIKAVRQLSETRPCMRSASAAVGDDCSCQVMQKNS